MQTFIIALVIIAVVLGALYALKANKRRLAKKRFLDLYSASTPMPRLTLGYSYGHPNFKVTFQAKSQLDSANASGLNARFRDFLAELHAEKSNGDNSFDIEKALSFLFEGEVEAIVASITAKAKKAE